MELTKPFFIDLCYQSIQRIGYLITEIEQRSVEIDL